MKLILVNPIWGGGCAGLVSFFLKRYPSFFVVLKALTPEDWQIEEINSPWLVNCSNITSQTLVAISCFSVNSYRAYAIAKKYREAGAKVVMGGPHVSFAVDEALCFCDSVVVGEVEGLWHKVLSDFQEGTLLSTYGPLLLDDYDQRIGESLVSNVDRVESAAYVESNRGCKYRCDFCAVGSLYQGKVRPREIENLVRQLKYISNKRRSLCFVDSNIFAQPDYARELFRKLRDLHIKWSAECSIDVAKNKEDIDLLKESGCILLAIGYESVSRQMQTKNTGKFSLVDKYLDYSRRLKAQGIKIKAQLMYGFEGDSLRDIFKAYGFLARLNPSLITYSFLTPYMSTELYKKYLLEGRLQILNWKKYDRSNIVFATNSGMPLWLEKIMFTVLLRYFTLFFFSSTGRYLAFTLLMQISIIFMLFSLLR